MQQPAVLAEPETLTQDSGKSNIRNPDGPNSTGSGEGSTTAVDSTLGGPAATTTAVASSTTPAKMTPRSWKMLVTRTSTASTSAASITSAAPGPSSSDPTAAGSSGSGGDGSSGRTDRAVAPKEQESRQSFVQPAAAAATTAGRGARPSSVKQAAAAAAAAAAGAGRTSVHVGYQKMRISSGGGNSATTYAAEADADEALSRPPPAPGTTTPRYRGTVPNPAVGGTCESSKRGHGPRSPMPPPSPGGSSDGAAAPPLSEEGGVTPRQPQATATTPSGNGANGDNGVVDVHLAEGELKAGGWKHPDSAGGGSFEIDSRHSSSTTTPNIATEKTVTRAGEEKPEEQSGRTRDGSGFEATAVDGKSDGGMTEREIIAAAEAAVASAEKAAASTVDRVTAQGTPPEFPVETAELLSDAAATTPGTKGKADTRGIDRTGKVQLEGTAAVTGGTRRQCVEKENLRVSGEDGGSVSRTVRDDNWWRQNAAKALAISAEMKKTPGRSRSRNGTPARSRSRTGTPARSRSRSGTPGHSRSATTRRGGVTPRDGRGTPSSRSGSVVGRAKGRNGGGGGSRSREDAGGWSTEDGTEGGVAGVAGTDGTASISAKGVMIPMDGIASAEVSPTFSTISSREQAERDRERLAAMNGGGDGGYRRSSWGVALPLSGTDDTPREHGGAHGARESGTGRRSRESSGWGLTSDDGGDWEQQRRRRSSLTSSASGVWSDDGVHGDDHDGSGGSSASTSMYSDEEEDGDFSSSRSSISTGYESSAMWKGSKPRQPGTPAGEDQNGDVGGHDRGSGKYAPPSPAWPLQHPPVGQSPDAVLSELEVSAVKKKAYYEIQAAAEAVESSTPSTGSDASSRQTKNLPSAGMGRMPSETRALLSSRGASLPEFFPFDTHPGSRGSRAGGGEGGPFCRAEASAPASGAPAAAAVKPTPSMPPRIQTSVSEGTILQYKAGGHGSKPQHASVEEAVAMVFAWSLLSRDGGHTTTAQSQQARPAGATPDTRHGGRGWRRGDSQYFFSSRGSSALGMSPAGMIEHHYERHRNPSPAEMRRHDSNASGSRRSRRRTAARQEHKQRRDRSATSSERRSASALDRRVRRALSTPPTPQERRQQQQREQRRRRQASRRELASSEQQNRAPPAIPPLPKVLFRPPTAATATGQQQRRWPQKQDQQQRQERQASAPSNIAFVVAPGGEEDGHVGNGGRVSRGKSWSFAGTPTSTVFSPSSAVANPFSSTRYTQHSAYSFYSNSNSPTSTSTSSVDDREETKTAETKAAPASTSGGGDGGGLSCSDGGVGKSTRPLPRATSVTDKIDDEGGRRLDADDGAQGRVTASAPQGARKQGRAGTDRRTARVTATARATEGLASDMGGSRRSAGSGRRPIYRTMSLRGRSIFSVRGGNASTAERRAVSMSSFRSRGEALREDGEYYRSYSWRGGGRGVANRVCSVLSARWLFSRNRNKMDREEKKREDRSRRGDSNSNVSRPSAYTSGGVVGVVHGGEFSSNEDGIDGDDDDGDDDVVDVTSSMDIPIDGAAGRAGKTRALGGSGGGPRDEDTSRPAVGEAGSATAGAGSVGPGTTAASGRKRISFPRSAFLGFSRSAQRSMSSYSFVQHDPASRAGGVGGGGGDGVGGVRASQSTTEAEADPGLAVDAGRGTLPATSVDFAAGGDGKASGSPKANRAAPRDNGGDSDVQYVNFNGHGGRAGGVVALRRGDGVAAVEIEGDRSVSTTGYSSSLKPLQAEQDEEGAKRKMDALLSRSRVHTHVNPVVPAAAGASGEGEGIGGGSGAVEGAE
ncbi:unnamed protein product [Ectocarpus sp. 12 AP-2014]